MKESRITCDTEIPISTSNGNKFNSCSGKGYHNYNLPSGKVIVTTTDSNKQQYDKPQKMLNDFPMEIIGSTQGTTTTTTTNNCVNNSNQSSDKCYSGIRNYDIPKDTINSNILESRSHPTESCTPVKQPLLHGHHHHHQKHLGSSQKSTRQPPPTIVLSPPDDASPEKVKVIFEYDNEKYPAQPNFLIRYKRIILSVAISLLIIFY
ncbi:hypothetical protein DINM_001718 [Dirofilaria immitis]|nr:hypothetical protein [Dirofilaria immitis]